jgi:hypothetical protein
MKSSNCAERPRRGPKPKPVTPKLLKNVEDLAGRGLNQKQICAVLQVSESWWYARQRESVQLSQALARGRAKGIETATSALMEQVQAGSVEATKFYLKNRDRDHWSDANQQQKITVAVSRMSDSELIREIRKDTHLARTLAIELELEG